jgi:hypothetical protein
MNRRTTAHAAWILALALLLPAHASAQWSQVHEQFYWPAEHNWEFRDNYRVADRLFNAFDYGHAILYERLYTEPGAVSVLEEDEYNFITRKLLVRPPRLPLEEGAIEIAYAKLAPEAKTMFEWAHVLHRQIYDVLASEDLSQAEKDEEVGRLLRYYKTRPDVAFSSIPKNMELMEGQYYSTVFRNRYPKFNGLIWGYHWLQVGLYEPMLLGKTREARQTGVTATVARFWQMIENPPTNMPRVMPMTAGIAPTFAARYPEAAIIFDNLHSMHDVISDILASPDVPRSRKREEILKAAERYRDNTSFVMTVDDWRQMPEHMGLANMGGPAVGLLPGFPQPTVERGAVMANMQHAQHQQSGDSAATHAQHGRMPVMLADSASRSGMMDMHERMMADPVIRQRVASDPVLQSMMRSMMGDTAMHGMHGAQNTNSEGRRAMEVVLRLLDDPAIEQRIHADPALHRLWTNPQVQTCIAAVRQLRAAGQPIPASCPAPKAATTAPQQHRH